MKTYLGTKVVKATPMNRKDYNDYRGLELPDNEDGSDEGMLVEYVDGGRPNHPDHEGYISWSPIDVFNNSYHKVGVGSSFSIALELLKSGNKVARAGWNGKGIFIKLQTPDEHSKMTSPYIFIDTTGLQTDNKHAPKSCVPWLASQTDMLAEDWVVV